MKIDASRRDKVHQLLGATRAHLSHLAMSWHPASRQSLDHMAIRLKDGKNICLLFNTTAEVIIGFSIIDIPTA